MYRPFLIVNRAVSGLLVHVHYVMILSLFFLFLNFSLIVNHSSSVEKSVMISSKCFFFSIDSFEIAITNLAENSSSQSRPR